MSSRSSRPPRRPCEKPNQVGGTPTSVGRSALPGTSRSPTKPILRKQQDERQTADDRPPSPSSASGPAHLILVTDMQSGSQIESLQVYAWPKELRLDVRKVAPQKRTNASAQILAASAEEGEDPDRVRVRVSNAADSESGKFSLAWSAAAEGWSKSRRESGELLSELPVQVPPGQTRVVRMPPAPPGVNALVLKGDAHTFRQHAVRRQPRASANVAAIHR